MSTDETEESGMSKIDIGKENVVLALTNLQLTETIGNAYRDDEHELPPPDARLFRAVVVELVKTLHMLKIGPQILKDKNRPEVGESPVFRAVQASLQKNMTPVVMEIAFGPSDEAFKAMDLLFVFDLQPDKEVAARYAGKLFQLLSDGLGEYEESSVMNHENPKGWICGVLLELDQETLVPHVDVILELAFADAEYDDWTANPNRLTALELLSKLPSALIAQSAPMLRDMLFEDYLFEDDDEMFKLVTQMMKSLDSATLATTFFGYRKTRGYACNLSYLLTCNEIRETLCEILAMIEPDDLKEHVPTIIEYLDYNIIESKWGEELRAEHVTPVLKLLSRFEPADLLAHAPAFEAFLRRDDIDEDHECRALAKEILGAIFEAGVLVAAEKRGFLSTLLADRLPLPKDLQLVVVDFVLSLNGWLGESLAGGELAAARPGAPGSAAARAEFDLAASAVPAASAG